MPLDGTSNPTTEIILGAIAYLESYGWHQGGAVSGAKRCMWGALREVADANNIALFGVSERIERANHIRHGRIPEWNDQPERTYEDVIQALERAAFGE